MRFNPTTYNPADDSSRRSLAPEVDASAALVLVLAPGRCGCGCFQPTKGKSRFRPGHDAALKGRLIRAHVTGTPVAQVLLDSADLAGANDQARQAGTKVKEITAIQAADEQGWTRILMAAGDRHQARLAEQASKPARVTKPKPEPKPASPYQVGTTWTLKVGRWDRQVTITKGPIDGKVAVEYRTKDGKAQTVATDPALLVAS